ncbi:DUF2057 family protein [Photobacterium sp. DNB23_23_1]|uniref:DUF2057 domain-containing protein n=1 Tax=Photobacterium pectinilyticum TaxID=2906793 RepID=A0ABT1N0P4_9GAMM|nr:DUF2057 family protein [Photobacterium sp. ZSDE20]MCQ1058270.1 DUF2057 domain-containing protein [Photobacterium sp. ZSDE20]MDD1823066.1 DUF2057 domain-containing protein [Photobacterium sp. ZSDE20]
MINTLKTFIATTALLSAGIANAAVEVTFDKDLELLVANGESMGLLAKSPESITLDNGANQLVVRVSKLVSYSGEYKKLISEPVVLTFDVEDTELSVGPTRHIVRDHQINGFDKNPVMKIDEGSQSFDSFHQGILLRTSGMMRDYVKELDDYNLAQGFVAKDVRPQLLLTSASGPAVATKPQQIQPEVSLAVNDNALILLQADYLRLTAEQKQTFLHWAQSQ